MVEQASSHRSPLNMVCSPLRILCSRESEQSTKARSRRMTHTCNRAKDGPGEGRVVPFTRGRQAEWKSGWLAVALVGLVAAAVPGGAEGMSVWVPVKLVFLDLFGSNAW